MSNFWEPGCVCVCVSQLQSLLIPSPSICRVPDLGKQGLCAWQTWLCYRVSSSPRQNQLCNKIIPCSSTSTTHTHTHTDPGDSIIVLALFTQLILNMCLCLSASCGRHTLTRSPRSPLPPTAWAHVCTWLWALICLGALLPPGVTVSASFLSSSFSFPFSISISIPTQS